MHLLVLVHILEPQYMSIFGALWIQIINKLICAGSIGSKLTMGLRPKDFCSLFLILCTVYSTGEHYKLFKKATLKYTYC